MTYRDLDALDFRRMDQRDELPFLFFDPWEPDTPDAERAVWARLRTEADTAARFLRRRHVEAPPDEWGRVWVSSQAAPRAQELLVDRLHLRVAARCPLVRFVS